MKEITNEIVTVIKEVSAQLQSLYGYANAEIVPAILKAISWINMGDMVGNLICAIYIPMSLYFMIRYNKKELEKRDGEELIIVWIAYFVGSLLMLCSINGLINNIVYIFHPEAKIINALLLKNL